MNTSIQHWDPSQKEAICHGNGPLFVSAGPGAGKTSVMIAHIQHLVHRLSIPPDRILAVTFTKAAAREMKERFMEISGRYSLTTLPRFGTIHSIFFEILRQSRSFRSYTMIKESVRRDFLLEQLRIFCPDTGEPEVLLCQLTAFLSRFVNSGYRHIPSIPSDFSMDVLTRISQNYQSYKNSRGWLDYDDILLKTYQLLTRDPNSAAYWQQKFFHILIDEFQDMNELQYRCLRILAAPSSNIYAVGDEDQTIYGFRGSSPAIIQRFLADYPDCRTVILPRNYRAPDILLTPARKLISHNKRRTMKYITGNPEAGDAFWDLSCCKDQKEQYSRIARSVLQYQEQGIPYSSQSVLLRSLRYAPLLLLTLQQYSIPVHLHGTHDMFLKTHFITKDFAAFFQLAQGMRNTTDILSLDMKALLRIQPICLPHISRYLLTRKKLPELYPAEHKELLSLKNHLQFLASLPCGLAAEYICKAMNYEQYLKIKTLKGQTPEDTVKQTLSDLKILLQQWKSQNDFLSDYHQHNETSSLNIAGNPRSDTENALDIRTMHSSKGLEFEVVYLPDMNKGILPDSRAQGDSLEEERRLLYVAMTRARRRLHMYYSEKIHDKAVLPSVFVYEIMR